MPVLETGWHLHGEDGGIGPNRLVYTVLDLDRALISHIFREVPTAIVHVRQWAMATDDPRSRAEQAIPWITELVNQYGADRLLFSSTNEADIESFGGHMTADKFHTWGSYQYRWAVYIHDAVPAARLAVAAPSPGHDEDGPDELVGYYILRPYVETHYVVLLNHSYIDPPDQDANMQQWLRYRMFRPKGYKNEGDPGGMYWITRSWTNREGKQFPILVSECNVTNVTMPGTALRASGFLERLHGMDTNHRVMGVTWFVWDSPDPAFGSMRAVLSQALQDAWVPVGEKEEPPVEQPEFKLGFATLAAEMRARGYTAVAMANESYNGKIATQPVALHHGSAWADGYFFYAPGGQPIYIGPDPKA